MRRHIARKAFATAMLTCAACPLFAQYEGGATADIGAGYRDQMLQDLVRSNTVPKPKRADVPTSGARHQSTPPEQVDARTNRSMTDQQRTAIRDARMREIRPEYERRVRTQGKVQADQWLARTAREMGRQDGESLRTGQR